jgi:hypothetical protein
VPVELVVVEVVPVVDVAEVPFVDVVAVFVTGAPVPVSVAVVPVDVGWSVSVDPVVVSAGLRLHATHRTRMAMMVMTPRMRIVDPPRAMRSNRRARLARYVKTNCAEVKYG